MDKDKRTGQVPIPANLTDWLTQPQIQALHQIESFGWELIFMRRPVFEAPIPVLMNDKGDQIGVLEEDGRINMNPDITLRD